AACSDAPVASPRCSASWTTSPGTIACGFAGAWTSRATGSTCIRTRRPDVALTIEQLNAADAAEAARLLDGLYEHSPWIAQAALAHRPFRSLGHLKQVMADIVRGAGEDQQLALIRAHPELAGNAMVAKTLTSESTSEQSKAGL